MCGICGVARRTGPADPDVVERMMAALVHRGPDGAGLSVEGPVGLGVRRLALLDIEGGAQPFTSEDGSVVVVFNGEIYNFAALRQDLEARGHVLRGRSDGAVLPHLYEENGPDFSAGLNGMFAIAVWDRRDGSLHLVRDRLGIKPLYYADRPDGLAFASEAQALLEVPGQALAPDPDSVWQFLTFQYAPDPATLFAGVSKVPAGHRLTWKDGRIGLHRYWQLRFAPDPEVDAAAAAAAVRRALDGAVRRCLTADRPVGLFLSGGVDSSALVALAKAHGPVRTYSVGFAGAAPDRRELEPARRVAEALGTEHVALEVTAREYADALPEIVRSQDDPVADPSAAGLWFLARAARASVTAVLSGEGADEMFGGYPIYREPAALAPLARLGLAGSAGRLASHLPPGIKGRGYLERASVPLEQRFIGGARLLSEEAKRWLWNGDPVGRSAASVVAAHYAACRDLDPPTRMQHVDCSTWLPGDILMKADKMTMAHSLELRVPFLDREVVDLALTLPTRLKLAHGTTKWVLRQAVRPLLPPDTVLRPKLGFPVPLALWLRQDLGPLAHDLLASGDRFGLLNTRAAQALLRAHERGEADHARPLFAIMTYLLWQRAFADRAGLDRSPPSGAACG